MKTPYLGLVLMEAEISFLFDDIQSVCSAIMCNLYQNLVHVDSLLLILILNGKTDNQ